MACRLIEGWESSTTLTHYIGKWTAMDNVAQVGVAGRTGQALRQSGNGGARRTFAAHSTWIVGAAYKWDTAGNLPMFELLDGATLQLQLRGNTAGTVSVYRGGSTLLGTSSLAMLVNTWYFVEWKAVIGAGTAGSTEVRVNGAVWLTLPNVNTQATAAATADGVRLGSAAFGAPGNVYYDDVYILDGTGSTNNDFLGDCKVEQLLPTGAGATTAWTPSTGSNWQCVDDVPPNSDTDYVASSTAAQTDTYAYGNLVTTTGTVLAVQATAFHRKDDAGSRSLALVARPGSTDRVGATQSVLDSYTTVSQLWETNPDTSAAWTIAAVNGSEFGVRLVA